MVDIKIEDIKPTDEVPKETIIIRQPRARRRARPKRKTVIIKQRTVYRNRSKKRAKVVRKINVNVNEQKRTIDEMLKLVKANQVLVDEMIRINSGVMENVIKLSSSVAVLTDNMNNFLTKEKREEMPSLAIEVSNDLDEKIRILEMKLNNIVNSVSRSR
ncbi:MAG: hypothetical protein HY831_04605 [Candidatus Aenigmarchaeota archaeon]|nr:hypothetical protein [Candidatus Aenigmarchaeota archaeon]